MGGGNSPSPFLGGVVNFWEPGDILTGLRGVLLVVPELLAGVATLLGLAMTKPPMVGGGVAIFPADSVIFSSTSAKNSSSFSSDEISLDDGFPDHGLETTEAGECRAEGKGEMEPGTRYSGEEATEGLDGVLRGLDLLPPLALNCSMPVRDERTEPEPVVG